MRKTIAMAACCLLIGWAGTAVADEGDAAVSDGVVKIGMMADMSGVYASMTGPGNVVAANMAIKDFGGTVLGKPIKLLTADHQNKPDVGSAIARRWIDEDHVDLLIGMTSTAVSLAVQGVAADKKTLNINIGAGSTDLTEDKCTKYGIHYVYDTHALPVGAAKSVVADGGKTWFFIAPDYLFGKRLVESTTKVVENSGGKVLGVVKAPLGSSDFASYLLKAKASGADVVALANAGTDMINTVKQAKAFGIMAGGQRLVSLISFVNDIKGAGLDAAQGLKFVTAFYWDRTDASRKWSKRFFAEQDAMPSMDQAGMYSAVMAYLKAVEKAGTDDSTAVRAALGNMTINDMFTQGGKILPNGLMLHDMFVVQAKTPAESTGPWDLLDVVDTIPADEAFIPLSDSTCPLVGS